MTMTKYIKRTFSIAALSLTALVLTTITAQTGVVQAAQVNFDILSSTPVGSWQLREDTNTDHKGRKSVIQIRSSMLSSEMRQGEKFYWIEMVMDSFMVKKNGDRKKDGDQMVMKTLVAESSMSGDPANVMTNLRGFGTEIIMQTGNSDPMRLTGEGGMFGSMMQAMGTEVNYNFSELGDESVTVAAGDFDTRKIQGSGFTEAKVVFKKIRVESDSIVWMSKKVPFGMVKSEGTSITNKKKSAHSSELLEFGMTGAISLITKEPQELPSLGDMFKK